MGARLPVLKGELVNENLMREPICSEIKRMARQGERLGSLRYGRMAMWPELARLLWPCGEGRFVCRGAL